MAKEYGQLAIDWYRHLFEFRNRVDPAHYYCIDYRDLVRNPAKRSRSCTRTLAGRFPRSCGNA